jgi:hypothetical protein
MLMLSSATPIGMLESPRGAPGRRPCSRTAGGAAVVCRPLRSAPAGVRRTIRGDVRVQLNAIFPVLAGMPPPVADLCDVSSDTRDITFRGDSRHVERLPSLTHLRRVWCLKTRPAFMPILTSCTQLSDLYLEQLSTSDLRFVEAFEQLNILRLDGATRVTDLRPLARLKTLRAWASSISPGCRHSSRWLNLPDSSASRCRDRCGRA